jgi:uncharacterized protein
MKLRNYTKYTSLPGKMKGLMFSRKKTVIFENQKECITSLHMFFVFFPIDVLFLDKNKRIVEIKRNFFPFMMYTPRKKAKFIVEIPSSFKTKAKVGMIVKF